MSGQRLPQSLPLLTDTEIAEDDVQNILHIHPAKELTECSGRQPQLLRHDFLPAVLRGAVRVLQREQGFLEVRALALTRHQGGLGSEEARGETHERVNQSINPGARRAGKKVNGFLYT